MRVRINLDTMRDVNDFVCACSKVGAPVFITDGNGLCVSAKSILGAVYAMEFDELWCECDEDIYHKIETLCDLRFSFEFFKKICYNIYVRKRKEENEMDKILYFDRPTQVRFFEPEEGDYVGGIAYCGEIICGCCGSVIDIEELYERVRDAAADGECTPMEDEVIQALSWIPINEEIIGDDFWERERVETTTEPPRTH